MRVDQEMNRQTILDHITSHRLVAIVRLAEAGSLLPITEALLEGGVEVVEYSLTTPGALEALTLARNAFGGALLLGAGTVLDKNAARLAIDSGAQFIVSPHFDLAIIHICHSAGVDVPVVPGALTPTELQLAWEAGGDLIKVFPASLGGPRYIREVLAPLPHLKLLPTGGVSMENLGDFLGAGAVAVAVGSSLVTKEIAASRDWKTLTERARRFADLASAVR